MLGVIGYTADAAVWCLACAEKRYGVLRSGGHRVQDGEGNIVQPLFHGYESDTPDHCTACGILIPSNLTNDGMQYVREAVANYLVANSRRVSVDRGEERAILEAWLHRWPYVLECPACISHGLDGWCVGMTGIDIYSPFLIHLCNPQGSMCGMLRYLPDPDPEI